MLDLDDTLVASARARRRARRTLRDWGIDPVRFAAAERRWWARYSRGGLEIEELRAGRLAEVGLTGDAAVAADLAYREVSSAIGLRRGARRLLTQLRAAGLATVILTNGSIDPQRRKLEDSGLLELVDAALVSEEIGWHKPDARAFAAALAAVGGRPGSSAMVGDAPENDVAGALAAGFARVVWMAPARRRPHPDARVATVRRLDQVLAALSA